MLSCVWLYDPMDYRTPGIPVLHQLLELTQTYVHWVSDAIQTFHPLLTPSSPAFSLSQHQGFSDESAFCIRWPKYWSFSFSISLFSEYSGMISFKIGWVWFPCCPRDFQESSSVSQFEALVLWHLVFYMVQQSYPYMTTGKTTALTVQTFVSKVMFLFFNTLST